METLQIEPKLESKTKDLEEKSQKFYGSCEKSLDFGLDSPKSLVSPDLENKGLKPVKSPVDYLYSKKLLEVIFVYRGLLLHKTI